MRHLFPRVVARPASSIVTEAIAAAHAAMYYPIGLSDRVCDRLSAPRWYMESDTARPYPVLLVHGIWHNQSWAMRLERTLEELGYVCWSVNYRTIGRTLDDAAAQVATYARALAVQHGVDKVHVVAHSLGGLVLRTAVARYGLGDLVAAAVTIASPHTGSPLALRPARHLPAIGALLDQIRPGSTFLRQLDAETTPGSARWTAIYSTADEIVPGRHGRLEHPALGARNVEVRGLGHLAVMFHPRVADAVRAALVAADVDTVTQVGLPHPA